MHDAGGSRHTRSMLITHAHTAAGAGPTNGHLEWKPILLCTSEAAFNCLFPQTLGATKWKKNPKGKNPFD